jgi:integrase/recombinase XerC
VLSARDVKALLRVSGQHARGFRDHCIFSLALGSGLRESEIVALNISDVTSDGKTVNRWITLRRFKGWQRATRATRDAQRVALSDDARAKIERYLKQRRQLPLWRDHEPLFLARGGTRRLSTRRAREIFAYWRDHAGIDPRFSFHALRHTYCSNVYRAKKDIVALQRLARHARIDTSLIYTHPTDDELIAAGRDVPS